MTKKRTDDDSRLAQAVLDLIVSLRPETSKEERLHRLTLAEENVLVVLNRGKTSTDPDYLTPYQPVVPPHSGQGADE
jgi:hypothetical protein